MQQPTTTGSSYGPPLPQQNSVYQVKSSNQLGQDFQGLGQGPFQGQGQEARLRQAFDAGLMDAADRQDGIHSLFSRLQQSAQQQQQQHLQQHLQQGFGATLPLSQQQRLLHTLGDSGLGLPAGFDAFAHNAAEANRSMLRLARSLEAEAGLAHGQDAATTRALSLPEAGYTPAGIAGTQLRPAAGALRLGLEPSPSGWAEGILERLVLERQRSFMP